MKIAKWLDEGNLVSNVHNEIATTEELIERAGHALDSACSHEILGNVVFKGEDDKYYVMTVEAVIGEANPEYLKDFLAEQEELKCLDCHRIQCVCETDHP